MTEEGGALIASVGGALAFGGQELRAMGFVTASLEDVDDISTRGLGG